MGRICPILNHPLKDGVLIENEALVKFIQKRNLDFLSHELVCRSCKNEITKLYNKKLKRALKLHQSRYHESSISTLKTSKTSTSSSAVSERSFILNVSEQHEPLGANENDKISSANSVPAIQQSFSKSNSVMQNDQNLNSSKVVKTIATDNSPVSNRSIRTITNISNANSILQAKQNIQPTTKKTTPAKDSVAFATTTNDVTPSPATRLRKRNIKDFFNVKQTQAPGIQVSQATSAVQDTPNKQPKEVGLIDRRKKHVVFESDDDSDVRRRHSKEPTTSKAAASAANKRSISALSDSDDDGRYSLNAFNGTRLPHIQPIPPKRKPKPDNQDRSALDVMNDYIREITGG